MIDSNSMYILIALLSILNFVRIFFMLIGSDIYDIRSIRTSHKQKHVRDTKGVTVIIPAYNEETGVIRTLESVMDSSYRNIQILVVDDGSTDKTLAKLRAFQRKHRGAFTIISQKNGGKASAINRAVKHWAKKELVMVLDADSLLDPRAIERMVVRFRNPNTIAAAANVKIIPTRSFLGVAQQYEYLISYRMKRSLSVFGAEYIIGGVGSTFRRKELLDSGLYDTDTMTEDIDMTVKLIRLYGNKKGRIAYAADALAYTEHVMKFSSLVKQRFRWKYGRMQTFAKNKNLFFSRRRIHSKALTWYQLPYAVFSELTLLVEPILVGFILTIVVLYGDIESILWVYAIVSGFVLLMLSGENTESWQEKLRLTAYLPIVYFLMYILTAVEFCALLKSMKDIRHLRDNSRKHGSWQHVERQTALVEQ